MYFLHVHVCVCVDDTVSLDFSKVLQQARMAKGYTQKELATVCLIVYVCVSSCGLTKNDPHLVSLQKVNEKPQVVNDYEAGRAIPNQQIISKLERAVGTATKC